jgi:hypothetical protein
MVNGDVTDQLQRKDLKAFGLLALIARRARVCAGGLRDTKVGEARLGDFRSAGLKTEKEYRCAKKRLEKMGLAKFVKLPLGTLATITDRSVFDLGVDSGCDGSGGGVEERAQQREAKSCVDLSAPSARIPDPAPCADEAGNGHPAEQPPESALKPTNRPSGRVGRVATVDAVQEWHTLVAGEERFSRLRGEEWAGIYSMWAGHRHQAKQPLSRQAVKIDALHMLKVLDAGGSRETVFEWIGAAITAVSAKTGKPWSGWFFSNKFSDWQTGLPKSQPLRHIYRGEESEA